MKCPDCGATLSVIVDDVFYTAYVCIECGKEINTPYN